MVKTASTMISLGTQAPDFSLVNIDGKVVSRSDFAGKPLLVAFICNHCPFVDSYSQGFAGICGGVSGKGFGNRRNQQQ